MVIEKPRSRARTRLCLKICDLNLKLTLPLRYVGLDAEKRSNNHKDKYNMAPASLEVAELGHALVPESQNSRRRCYY